MMGDMRDILFGGRGVRDMFLIIFPGGGGGSSPAPDFSILIRACPYNKHVSYVDSDCT